MGSLILLKQTPKSKITSSTAEKILPRHFQWMHGGRDSPTDSCIGITGALVKMQNLIQQIEGGARESAFLLSSSSWGIPALLVYTLSRKAFLGALLWKQAACLGLLVLPLHQAVSEQS